MTTARFRAPRFLVVAGSSLLAFVVRAVLLVHHRPPLFASSDNTWYAAVARSIATGHGVTLDAVTGGRALTFRFPPAYPALLAAGQHLLFWVRATDADLWTSAVFGAAAAGVVAALAWRLAAAAKTKGQLVVAAVAGGLFAVNPLLAGASVSLMAESLYVLAVAATLLLVDRLVARATTLDVVLLGIVVGVGALTRSEGLVILGAIVGTGLVVARRRGMGARPWIVVLAIGLAFPLGWSIFASLHAHRTVAVATNSGSLLLGANCPATAHGSDAGFWNFSCLNGTDPRLSAKARAVLAQVNDAAGKNVFSISPVAGARVDAQLNSAQLAEALHRMVHAPGDTVRAVPFRVLRGVGLYWSRDQDSLEYFEGRDHHWEIVGRWFHLLVVLPLAVVALVALVRRRLRGLTTAAGLAPALTSLVMTLLIISLTYGSTRFRVAAEPALAVLAAFGAAVLTVRRSKAVQPAQ